MTTALMRIIFLWINPKTPSGFSAFIITSQGILHTNILHSGIVLYFSINFDMSQKSLEKLTKTKVIDPTYTEGIVGRLSAFQVLAELFFGSRSFPDQGITKKLNLCSKKIYPPNKALSRPIFYCQSDLLRRWKGLPLSGSVQQSQKHHRNRHTNSWLWCRIWGYTGDQILLRSPTISEIHADTGEGSSQAKEKRVVDRVQPKMYTSLSFSGK